MFPAIMKIASAMELNRRRPFALCESEAVKLSRAAIYGRFTCGFRVTCCVLSHNRGRRFVTRCWNSVQHTVQSS